METKHRSSLEHEILLYYRNHNILFVAEHNINNIGGMISPWIGSKTEGRKPKSLIKLGMGAKVKLCFTRDILQWVAEML